MSHDLIVVKLAILLIQTVKMWKFFTFSRSASFCRLFNVFQDKSFSRNLSKSGSTQIFNMSKRTRTFCFSACRWLLFMVFRFVIFCRQVKDFQKVLVRTYRDETILSNRNELIKLCSNRVFQKVTSNLKFRLFRNSNQTISLIKLLISMNFFVNLSNRNFAF